LHGPLRLLIQQPEDFIGQLQKPGEVCFTGGLFAELAPVGPVFVVVNHEHLSPVRAVAGAPSNRQNGFGDTHTNACQVPKSQGPTNPRPGNKIAAMQTIARPREDRDFLHAPVGRTLLSNALDVDLDPAEDEQDV